MQTKLTPPPKFYKRALSVWPHLLLRITVSSDIAVCVFQSWKQSLEMLMVILKWSGRVGIGTQALWLHSLLPSHRFLVSEPNPLVLPSFVTIGRHVLSSQSLELRPAWCVPYVSGTCHGWEFSEEPLVLSPEKCSELEFAYDFIADTRQWKLPDTCELRERGANSQTWFRTI